jgi:hypothetical protein
MATPLSATAAVQALQAEGVTVKQYKTWSNHNRGLRGDGWGPVHGVVLHHTVTKGATPAQTANSVEQCYVGYPDPPNNLPGPLCHGVIDKQGVVHLVGYGRANHAGGGDPKVLAAVSAESYGDRPPATHEHQGSAGAVDGNVHFYGFECINLGDGKDPWPAAQLEAIERVSAAICRHHGWSSKSAIGHLEWSDYKSDPRGFSMVDMRKRVATRLGQAATPTSPTYEPFPGTDWFKKNPKSAIVTAMGKRLVAEGCSAYSSGPGPQWTDADKASYAKWQRKLGYSGTAADGWPGKASWDKLKVPNS